MGHKQLLLEQYQRSPLYDIDDFFEAQFITFDVRTRMRISMDHLDNMFDKQRAIKQLKKDLRSKMLKEFRKELSKQIRDQLG